MAIRLPPNSPPVVQEEDIEYVDVETREFPDRAAMDCCYNSFLVADDGRLYMGTCCEYGTAHLMMYDPKDGKIRVLAALDDLIPDRQRGYAGQGKIHTPLCQGNDGCIYGATHMDILFPFWSSYYDAHGYAGGHWFRYDPRQNRLTDLGLAAEKEGILTMAMDRQRGILYGLTWPRGRLIAYDIAKGITEDKGRVSIHLSRYMICMSDGTVYVTGRNGHIAFYRPGMSCVQNLPVRLRRRMGELFVGDVGKDTTFTACVEWEKSRSFLSFIFRTGDVFRYDQRNESVEYYSLFNAGFYCNVQSVVSSDRKVYYAIGEGDSGKRNEYGRIFRFDPAAQVNELIGYVRSGEHTDFFHISGGAIAPDDTMYWFALRRRSPEDGPGRLRPLGASGCFMNTQPVLIIYNPH